MFHAHDGWFFERLGKADTPPEQYGGVRIHVHENANPDTPAIMIAEFTADEWASIVASCSALGETGTTWRMLRELQR